MGWVCHTLKLYVQSCSAMIWHQRDWGSPVNLGTENVLNIFKSTSEETGALLMGSRLRSHPPCPLQLFQTPTTHVRRFIGAQNQSPRKRPKRSLTSFEATWNQSRPISPSIPTPRCYCFPMDIHQNYHLTMRTWYVEKTYGLCPDRHHHWLSQTTVLYEQLHYVERTKHFHTKGKN